MRLAIAPYMLKFKHSAGTSRGVLTEKPTYFIKLFDERNPDVYGLGECSVFPGLSPEADQRYEYKLIELLANIAIGRPTDLSHHSSVQFGLEQALRDFASGGRGLYFPSAFTAGDNQIDINGLVWMGRYDEMLSRLEEKIEDGFHCIKIKIGAIAFDEELKLIKAIRDRFTPDRVTVRVDANGGFTMDNIFPVLKHLADLAVHSIEQPIPAGNAELMSFVCKMSPVPVALDEELIGIYEPEQRRQLLETIRPSYIILKPSLCGGFSGAEQWIEIAENLDIGWWVTSALESNIGLNALAQWTVHIGAKGPQGLGTGGLFTNNIATPIYLQGEQLRYNPAESIDREAIAALDWKY